MAQTNSFATLCASLLPPGFGVSGVCPLRIEILARTFKCKGHQ